ncbi:folate-binding protein YgfZ [Aestuariibacter sp. A3R04]|uniref:CAF17-like 4Fe-4S cluster assembly/insertion protein YgfZ n=1 Tax=Aestuariibacter sp. A3R04 TaxID=2841571 RepID=UPI001C082A06|nr:glycine cleavage system protein T [Aestuariibacter sp. A3R04]MBU3021871.1 glycine cleavage system protein T [Aestuariibacter sp. A3R04]
MQRLDHLSNIARDFVVPLHHLSVLSVSGEQRDDYLHGQLTVDTKTLSDSTARRTAHCDFKGKTWSLSILCRYEDAIWLCMNADCASHSLAQLNKYGVFSKVDIIDTSDTIKAYALCGSRAREWIIGQFGSLPNAPLSAQQSNLGVVIKLEFNNDLFMVLLTAEGQSSLQAWAKEMDITEYGPEIYEALSIQQGIPDISGSTINEFVPQMMNFHLLDGIDFNKGCYMGQEVVARTRYLGKNKRAAFSFCLPEALDVSPGDTIEKSLGENWRRGGTIIRKAVLGSETWLMAVLPNDTATDTLHRLSATPQIEFKPLALPYPIEATST